MAICALFLSACTSQQEQAANPVKPANFPEAFYLQAVKDVQNSIYRIDGKSSQILVRAYPGGAMASLGHEHIIASQDVQGYLLINKATRHCRADLFVPVNKLNVDDPQLRAAAGLDTNLSVNAIADTRENMLNSIDAANFPFALLHSSDCYGSLSGKESKFVLTIHGMQQARQLASSIQTNQEEQLIVSGGFSILQTEFGIEPFSLFNGLIKVDNKLDLTYKLIFTEID